MVTTRSGRSYPSVSRAIGSAVTLANAARVASRLLKGNNRSTQRARGVTTRRGANKATGVEIDARTGVRRKTVVTRRKKRTRSKSVKAELNKLKKRVGKMKVNLPKFSHLTQKSYHPFIVTTQPGYQRAFNHRLSAPDLIEAAVLDAVPYTQLSAPSTESTSNVAGATEIPPMKWNITAHFMLDVRNNATLPVHVDFYYLKPKKDTTLGPDEVYYTGLKENGATDVQAIYTGTAYYIHPCFWPTDSKLFTQMYEIIKHDKVMLNPGDEWKGSYDLKLRAYDPNLNDETGTTLKEVDTRFFFVRLQGVVTHHDTDASVVGYGDGQIDIIKCTKWQMKYAGSEIPRYDVRLEKAGSVGTEYEFTTTTTPYDTAPAAVPVVAGPIVEVEKEETGEE